MKNTGNLLFAVFVLLFSAATSQAQTTGKSENSSAFVRLDRVTASRALPNGIEIRSGAALMQITALRDDVVRVRVGAEGQLPEDASWSVLPAARTASVPVAPESSPVAVGFKTAKLIVSIAKDPLALTVTDLAGHVIAQDMPQRPVEFHGAEFRVYRKSPIDEHYYGLGDKPGPLDRRNESFTNWNTDSFEWQESTDPIYKSIPFVLTLRKGIASGFFLDNTWRSNFEFNKEYRDGYSFGSEGGPLDYYILYGPAPKQVEETWAWLTGPTPLPPLWTFGFQQSRWAYAPESDVRRIATRMRAERIPCDVLWLDIDYQYKNRPFTIDTEGFPHFDQLIKDLSADHFRTVVITDLHIAAQTGIGYKPYDEGIAGDHFVKNPDGSVYVGVVWPGKAVFPDFTQKAARDWWGTLYKDLVAKGVAGFWNDMNEPAIFEVASKTMPDDTQHRIDEPGFKPRTANHLEVHNIFGMENSRGTFEGVQRLQPNLRPFVLTRASFAGGQRYAATWTGDNTANWSHLRQTIPQLVNLGLSGFAMSGADVGGFADSPQPELLTRWLEVAAFQPIDRDHSSKGTHPQEPWENGSPEDVAIRRRYIEERYRLMPYIYTTAEEMSRTGLPIMRPLFLEFPSGDAAGEPWDTLKGGSFMLGSALLIAQSPFPDTVDDYSVALPPVGWYDYWTGAPAVSGSGSVGDDHAAIPPAVDIHRTLDTLPVFVRAGSIVPEQPVVQSTAIKPEGPLTLRVYPPLKPGADCSGSVYLDDGLSYNFRKGEFLRQHFHCKATPTGVTITVDAREGSFIPWWSELAITVYGASKPAASAKLAGLAVETAYDDAHHSITATVPNNPKGLEFVVQY